MSDLDNLLNDADGDTDLVKSLRKALKEANRQVTEYKTAADQAAKENRSRTLADALKAKGLSEKAAKYFPADVDPTPEAIDNWLAEDGELFGITPQAGTADQATVNAAQQITSAATNRSSSAQVGDVQSLIAAIQNAQNPEELAAAYAAAGLTQPGD
jgi:glutamyl/glutaminyl-tRNA synthetase